MGEGRAQVNGGASTPQNMPSDNLRARYEADVAALHDAAMAKLGAGMHAETVARWAVEQRNLLKKSYRALTPAAVLARIESRTLDRYGSLEGPTADELRAQGRSWADIIGSATRPGEHGDALFSGAAPD